MNIQYIINPTQNHYSIIVSSLISGSYNLKLVCDGEIPFVELMAKN